MTDQEPRWQQRFRHYQKALQDLSDAIEIATERDLTKLESKGLVKAFELTHELAWQTLQSFYEAQGESSMQGSKDVTRLAIQRGLIENGRTWMAMIDDRNRSVHTYNEEVADRIVAAVKTRYYSEFVQLNDWLQRRLAEEENQ